MLTFINTNIFLWNRSSYSYWIKSKRPKILSLQYLTLKHLTSKLETHERMNFSLVAPCVFTYVEYTFICFSIRFSFIIEKTSFLGIQVKSVNFRNKDFIIFPCIITTFTFSFFLLSLAVALLDASSIMFSSASEGITSRSLAELKWNFFFHLTFDKFISFSGKIVVLFVVVHRSKFTEIIA